ncbi:MAG: sortase, partial [Aristaeellaceae bacterium]
MGKRKHSAGILLMLLGGAMLLGAAGYLAVNLYEENQANSVSASAVTQLRQLLTDATPEPQTLSADLSEPVPLEPTPSPLTVTPVPDLLSTEQPLYVLNPDVAMPEQVIDGLAYIGVMTIPKLGLELPVISEWSYPNLKFAPCRFTGSVYRNDMIICGHNYLSHFRRFVEMEDGDEILFTDMDGNLFRYEVILKELIGRNDTER